MTNRVTTKMASNDNYDCIVIGGGPAGATCATILADHKRRVLLLEKTSFPRHHVGESLMPQTYWTFKRLGMLEKLKASDFPRKESVQFISAAGSQSQPFFFADRDPNEWSYTWQVQRDKFDHMMLDNAKDHGVEVRENVSVKEVLFDGQRATGVRVLENENTAQYSSAVVVDASGQSTVIAKQLGLRQPDPFLKNGTIYAYYQGVLHDQGRNAGATIIIQTEGKKGWFWFIPLPGDTASIGIIAPPTYLFGGRGDDPLATFEEEIKQCPDMANRLKNAKRISQAYVTSNFSYGASQMSGEGWLLIGDAYAFLDPIYSSGVMVALKTGELAADTIHKAIESGDTSAKQLGEYGPELAKAIHMLRQLIHAYYDKNFSFGKFTREYPQHKDHIVRLLIGDVFNDEVGEVFSTLKQIVNLPAATPFQCGTTV